MRDRNRSIGLLSVSLLLVTACAGPGASSGPGGSGGPAGSGAGSPRAGSPGAGSSAAGAPTDGASAGAGTAAPGSPAGTDSGLEQVRLQLQWEPQAQFAGYFAADREGYYE